MSRARWFFSGLFLTALATLCLEILDTRLLSAMAWYHLSFFAVSTAMFGMSAGALRIYLGGEAFQAEAARGALYRYALALAVTIPVCHLANLVTPVESAETIPDIVALAIGTIMLAIPFYMAGVVVTLALTRIPIRIGIAYGVDLIGAAIGTLLVVPLLSYCNIPSSALVCGALASMAAVCFARFAGRGVLMPAALGLLLVSGAVWNERSDHSLRVWFMKGKDFSDHRFADELSNFHSHITVQRLPQKVPAFWAAGKGHEKARATGIRMLIDGSALTVMTQWDGQPESIDWCRFDVTSLPYHLRKGGDAAVIGVGGGRDLLTALWGDSRSVIGIEINGIFVELLEGKLRNFAGLANDDRVTLVHDEARSHLAATDRSFDVLQMSLIDTWASTGAGAMTLTENGLYTLEAWDVFLGVLKPGGILSVSRWYDPKKVSETNRLLSLTVASLLRRGVEDPSRHIALVSHQTVASLVVSTEPLTAEDIHRVHATAEEYGFQVLLAPDIVSEDASLGAIAAARSTEELVLATEHPDFDYSPATDDRPFFFNMLKPSRAFEHRFRNEPGVVSGNLTATKTLVTLFIISAVLVLIVLMFPLLRSGLPNMDLVSFGAAVAYFAAIGLGFMLVQIPAMQRFSVFLGHPTYAVVVILFSMILMTGVGSVLSERIRFEQRAALVVLYPLLIAAAIFALDWVLPWAVESTVQYSLPARCAVVVALLSPVSLLLGLGFPVGLRLVRRISDDALPWMWGVNGACGVLSAVAAAGISMWASIRTNFQLAMILYASLSIWALVLWVKGRPTEEPG